MLCEVRERQIPYALICVILKNQTERNRDQICSRQRRGAGVGEVGEGGQKDTDFQGEDK